MAAKRTKYDQLAGVNLEIVNMMIDRRLSHFMIGDKILGSAIVGYIGGGVLPPVPLAKMIPDVAADPPLDPTDLAGMQVRVAPEGDSMELVDVSATDAAAKVLAWTLFS